MKGRVMAPFRAPRVRLADSEIQAITEQRNLREIEARRLAIPPLLNPYPRGIKLMSEREADEVARHGEVLRWSSDSDDEKTNDSVSDSEDPTELGVVWSVFSIMKQFNFTILEQWWETMGVTLALLGRETPLVRHRNYLPRIWQISSHSWII